MGDLGLLLGLAAILFGLFFSLVGVIGLVRMPDLYTRLHATGKVSTLGLFGLVVGTAFLLPEASGKLAALAAFAILTLPVSTHAIAKAAYSHGVPLARAARDDFRSAQGEGGQPTGPG